MIFWILYVYLFFVKTNVDADKNVDYPNLLHSSVKNGTLKITNVTEKEIYLKWSPPQKHQPTDYLLHYECQENFCKSEQIKQIFVNSATIKIENLRPSSHCMMNITSQKTNQSINWIKAKTKDAIDINKNAEFPRSISSRNREIVIELQKCTNFSGPIKYKFKFKCLSEWCKNKNITYSYNLLNYTDSIKLNTSILQPFATYKPTVLAERVNVKELKKYGTIQSSPGQPNKVRNLSVYCANNTHLWLRWQHPYPPTGKITNYTIQYKSSGSLMSAHVQNLGPCDLWDNFICVVITNLKSNTLYTIQVRARNEGVSALGLAESIKKYTTQSASQPSRILEVEALNQNKINLIWAHPFFMNGPLSKFLVTVKNNGVVKEHTYHISEYQKNYTLTLQLEYYKKYNISVRGINKFEGEENTVQVILLPPISRLSLKPFIEVCLKNNCSLLVPLSSKAIEHRNFTIFVLEQIKNLTISEVKEIFQNFKNSTRTQWIVRRAIRNDKYTRFNVGENTGQAVSLENTTYKMYLITGNFPHYEIHLLWKTAPETEKGELPVIIAVLISTVVVVSVVGLLILYRFKKCPFKTETNNSDDLYEIQPFVEYFDGEDIEIKIFEYYLLRSMDEDSENNELRNQYQRIPMKYYTGDSYGSRAENSKKNRYKNIVPYDSTRVVLKDNDGDYINANYIDGYEAPRTFIATQTPLPNTISDFWAMVWQEKTSAIVMLTENGKRECEYLPEYSSKIGKFFIENISTSEYPDYIHRKLQVKFDKETHLVDHLQYLTWPDHGVPPLQDFAIFMQKFVALPRNAPIIVHCHVGCGRTGTLILCDIALAMAAKEKKINFLKILRKMRQQRPNLVDCVEQYIFAHFVVLECMLALDFSIPMEDNFQEKLQEALKDSSITSLINNVNRVTDTNEVTNFWKKFSITIDEKALLLKTSKYLMNNNNAVIVDGFKFPNRFVVAQQPLPNTISDFWKMVQNFDIGLIVSLNEIEESDKRCPKFWPKHSKQNLLVNDNKVLYFDSETFYKSHNEIKVDYNNEKDVVIIEVKNWKRETLTPKNIEDLIYLWKEICDHKNKILVTCYDGITASGLFVALSFLIEKMDKENVCDVFSAVRTVKNSRVEFVRDPIQVKFLYTAAAQIYIEAKKIPK